MKKLLYAQALLVLSLSCAMLYGARGVTNYSGGRRIQAKPLPKKSIRIKIMDEYKTIPVPAVLVKSAGILWTTLRRKIAENEGVPEAWVYFTKAGTVIENYYGRVPLDALDDVQVIISATPLKREGDKKSDAASSKAPAGSTRRGSLGDKKGN